MNYSDLFNKSANITNVPQWNIPENKFNKCTNLPYNPLKEAKV